MKCYRGSSRSQTVVVIFVMMVIAAGLYYYDYRKKNDDKNSSSNETNQQEVVNLTTKEEAQAYVIEQIAEDVEIVNGEKRLGPFANCDEETVILSQSEDGNWEVICHWTGADLVQISIMTRDGRVLERPTFMGNEQ